MNYRQLLFGSDNRIGRRLIVWIVAFSSLITLIISAVQLTLDYHRLCTNAEHNLDGVSIYVPTIADSLWNFDDHQLQLALDGLVSSSSIDRASIQDPEKNRQWQAGKAPPANSLVRRYALSHRAGNQSTEIGMLEVVASLDAIYSQIASEALGILLGNGLKTFLVASFMWLLITRLVTHRLENMAHDLRQLVPTVLPAASPGTAQPLPAGLDEVDEVAWTIATTSDHLHRAVAEQRRLHDELARERDHLDETVKHRTTELVKARDAAETANVAKSAFLANMSHEIRTPLNAINGMAFLIRRNGLPPAQLERLNKMEAAGAHLLQIINAVLDLSKIEAGKFTLEEAPVVIESLCGNVIAMLHDRAQAKHLQLSSHVQPLSQHLLGDATRLQQALLNYVANAVKFTESGRVDLTVFCQEENATSALLRFEVTDTGIGIAPETAPRLFSSFEQADNSTTRKYGGNGLGLSITRKIAQLMGGDAGMTSTLGAGSTFWFTARLQKGQAADPPA